MRTMPGWSIEQSEFDKIVLDTGREVAKIKNHLNTSSSALREDEIYEVIVDAVMYDEHAELELLSAIHYEWGCLDISFPDPIKRLDFTSTIELLGRRIIDQLRTLGLYRNGAINYRFGSVHGVDLVLYSNEYYINNVTIPSIIDTPFLSSRG